MKMRRSYQELLRLGALTLAGLVGACGGGAATPTCAEYCTTIAANCSGDQAQYADQAQCLNSCAAFSAGAATDTSGNTLGCRIYHAGAAKSDAKTHCVHAGPGGAGMCGTDCEGFCTIAQKVCAGANAQFMSAAACATSCATFKVGNAYSIKETAGDSLSCRLYHLTVASKDADNAMTHCPHIVAASPVCK